MAVSGVAFNINSLLWMLPNALGMGVSAHVGNALGAGQASQAKMVVEVGPRCWHEMLEGPGCTFAMLGQHLPSIPLPLCHINTAR